MTNTSVTLLRVLKAHTEKVGCASSDPNAPAFWLPTYGYLGIVHKMDFHIQDQILNAKYP